MEALEQAAKSQPGYGAQVAWEPSKPRLDPFRLIVSWLVAAASVYVAAGLVPGVSLEERGGAFLVAAVIAVLNAILPPVVAALRLPFMLALGFLLVLLVDAGALVARPRGAAGLHRASTHSATRCWRRW